MSTPRLSPSHTSEARTQRLAMEWIPGGTFTMGSDHHYREEAPAHRETVGGFWIDRWPVTNGAFRQFVEATGHVTLAERRAGSGATIRAPTRSCWSRRRSCSSSPRDGST